MPERNLESTPDIEEAERRIAECMKSRSDRLDLGRLALEQLPEGVRKLTWLRDLTLINNSIRSLPSWIGELTELRYLDVQLNPLDAMPSSFARLIRLRSLLLGPALPTAADEAIGSLTKLGLLTLHHMRLTRVPEWIRRLKRLVSLHLYDNELTQLPQWLGELKQLEELDIQDNPRLDLPAEIARSNDARRILNYYFRTSSAASRRPLNEFKLILVGRGGVGKTTLVNLLVTDRYKQFKRTPGISITKWPSKIDGDDVNAHVWDFGGQEIMHGTHRFFMTERALYLVLISGREGTEDHDAEYWLSLVRSFAGDVPVIVLLHKWSDYRFELNRELLREKYGRNIAFLETDSESGHGIKELRERICQLARDLPGLKAAWPDEWRRVKEALPSKKRSWMTFDDFRGFCREQGVIDAADQEILAASLHDLGLMLSYRSDQTLRDFGVLNPQWVTKGIYEMLNSPVLRAAGGTFTVKTFAEVLAEKTYPKRLHVYLLALMRRFQLCHPLDTKGERHLIPELLTKEEPKLDADFPAEQCLGFIYRYGSVLPEGLLPRFIVETYVLREPKRAWRTGVVLERANCRAVVRGDMQARTITIRVTGSGSGRRELLGIIREHFERIHRTYEKLPVTELVPVPGYPDAHVKHDLLLKYERSRRETIPVEVDGGLMDFSVSELLDGVDLPGAPRGDTAQATTRRKVSQGIGRGVFISYAPKDSVFLDQLRGALVTYERVGALSVWAAPLIEAGQAREREIVQNIDRAEIVVLLLSNHFFRSYQCMENELARAADRHAKGECVILPIVVRPCRFDMLSVGDFQVIQPGGKAISEHRKADRAWLEVTKEIDRVLEGLKKRQE